MNRSTTWVPEAPQETLPQEWRNLQERVRTLPAPLRAELEPVLKEALEHARFRGRVLHLAKDALERSRLECRVLEFDLHATKREKEALRRRLEA